MNGKEDGNGFSSLPRPSLWHVYILTECGLPLVTDLTVRAILVRIPP